MKIEKDELEKYYQAYEKRYSQIYKEDMLWSSDKTTPEVLEFLKNNNASKEQKILELGCGEGRDAIFLLNQEYNVLAVDYSKTVINKCKILSKNKFNDSFKQFDLLVDKLNRKFDFIYSVAVLHMLVLDKHRKKFWRTIFEHLEDDGKALICIMGDGTKEYSSDIEKAFENTERLVTNNNIKVAVATTSCRIVNWKNLEKEINEQDLIVEQKWISNDIPEFNPSMCVIVSKKEKVFD